VILVDTSVWVDHLRSTDAGLIARLEAGEVLAHPFVIGEICLGHLRQRAEILDALSGLPPATVATGAEVLRFIEQHALFGQGIGYVDAHLLAATRLTPGTTLWTRDSRLRRAAEAINIACPAA
jgi:predicted nucleic acid-binding protein